MRIDFEKYGRQKLDANASESQIEKLPANIYCDLVESLAEKCGQHSLLEIWRYREDLIMTATQEEILDAVNILETSPWFGHVMNYTQLLGGVRRNSSGHIVSASTGLLLWSISVPDNTTVVESQGSGVELELGDETSLAWEQRFVSTAQQFSEEDFEVKILFDQPNVQNVHNDLTFAQHLHNYYRRSYLSSIHPIITNININLF